MAKTDTDNVVSISTESAPSILGEPATIKVLDREMTAQPVKLSMFTMITIESDAFRRMRLVMKLLDQSLESEDSEWLRDQLYDNDSPVEMVTFSQIFQALQEAFAERPISSQTD